MVGGGGLWDECWGGGAADDDPDADDVDPTDIRDEDPRRDGDVEVDAREDDREEDAEEEDEDMAETADRAVVVWGGVERRGRRAKGSRGEGPRRLFGQDGSSENRTTTGSNSKMGLRSGFTTRSFRLGELKADFGVADKRYRCVCVVDVGEKEGRSGPGEGWVKTGPSARFDGPTPGRCGGLDPSPPSHAARVARARPRPRRPIRRPQCKERPPHHMSHTIASLPF